MDTDKLEVLSYSNLDFESIVTPVNVHVLNTILVESNYNSKETEFLVDGFTNGFDIG